MIGVCPDRTRPVFVSPMSVRYFTLEEARAELPELKRLMAELLERRGRVVRSSQSLGDFFEDLHSDIGSPRATELVDEFERIETLVAQIQDSGCVIKNLNAGLIDFLSQVNGREVYLCWRYGEDTIAFYHELHTGFQGRIPL